MAAQKGFIMLKKEKLVLFSILFVLLASCTMETSRYAMVSTRASGVFDNENATKVTVAKNTEKQKFKSWNTELDQLLKKRTGVADAKKFALVIGIKDYVHHTDVNYADNSAKSFALAARNLLGIPGENIFILENRDATSGQIKTKLAYMKELAEEGDSIYLFFAGHGVPGTDGKTYLLPSDMSADAIHLEPQLELNRIYETLDKSSAEQVFVFVDSCFSGKNDEGGLLYKGVAPVFKKSTKQYSSNKLFVMTAGGPTDFANQYESQHQRMFSYFLIKGLLDKQNDIANLYKYIRKNVKRESLRLGLGYKQIPQLQMPN